MSEEQEKRKKKKKREKEKVARARTPLRDSQRLFIAHQSGLDRGVIGRAGAG